MLVWHKKRKESTVKKEKTLSENATKYTMREVRHHSSCFSNRDLVSDVKAGPSAKKFLHFSYFFFFNFENKEVPFKSFPREKSCYRVAGRLVGLLKEKDFCIIRQQTPVWC